MKKQKRPLAQKAKVLTDIGALVCAVFVAINIAIIFASVFMRYVFNKPILGTTELVALLMPFIAYFGIGYTSSVNGHVQMAACYNNYKGRHKYISRIIIYGITLIFFALLFYMGVKNFAASVAKMEKVTAAVTLYAWVGKFAIPAGSLIMLIQDFFLLLDAVVGLVHYKPGQEQEETPAAPEA